MHSRTYRGFLCTEVHREINTVEDPFWHIGPLGYRCMNSSSSGKKKRINQSILSSRARLCGDSTVSSCRTRTTSRFQPSNETIHILSKSAPVSFGLPTRWKFLQSPNHRRPRQPGYRRLPRPTAFSFAPRLYRVSPRGSAPIIVRDKLRDGRWSMDSNRGEKLHGAARHSPSSPLRCCPGRN